MKNGKSFIIILFIVFLFLFILSSCRTSDIPSARIDSFSEVRTIQVLVNQSYYDDAGNKIEDFSLPIYEMCRIVLHNSGFRVVDESKDKYDAVLNIKIKGTALQESYYIEKSYASLYTGARIEGDISISVDNINSLKTTFSEVVEPPEVVTFWDEPHAMPPHSAPFDKVEWQKHFFLLLYDIWGIKFLSKSLDVKDIFTRRQVIEALAEVKDPSSVDILINALGDKDLGSNCDDIAEALGKKGDKSAVPALIGVLENSNYSWDSWDREAAAEALGEIGDESALEALKQASKEDEIEDVREACMEAVDKILEKINNK